MSTSNIPAHMPAIGALPATATPPTWSPADAALVLRAFLRVNRHRALRGVFWMPMSNKLPDGRPQFILIDDAEIRRSARKFRKQHFGPAAKKGLEGEGAK